MRKVFSKVDKEKLASLLLKYIRVKSDFENLIKRVSDFVKIEQNSKLDIKKQDPTLVIPDGWDDYLALVQREMISPVKDGNFLKNLTEDDSTKLEIYRDVVSLFTSGKIAEKKKYIIHDYNFSLYYGSLEYDGYKDLNNIESEINRIFSDIDTEETLRIFLTSLIPNDSNLVCELLTINNEPAAMFSNNNIVIYSMLINYSYSDIKRYSVLENFLGITIPENWDEIRDLFIKFLKEIDTRTIHY